MNRKCCKCGRPAESPVLPLCMSCDLQRLADGETAAHILVLVPPGDEVVNFSSNMLAVCDRCRAALVSGEAHVCAESALLARSSPAPGAGPT